MAKYKVNYNYNNPEELEFDLDDTENLFDKVVDCFLEIGFSIDQISNSLQIIVKNLETSEKYKLNSTCTDFEKI